MIGAKLCTTEDIFIVLKQFFLDDFLIYIPFSV